MNFLHKSRTIAPHGFNRWLVPPAALSIHLCIGQIYAYSVFNAPIEKLIGISSVALEDWKRSTIVWVFSIALFFLGASAAVFGKWLERGGPRRGMFWSAVCFSSGFFISALGLHWHNLFLFYLGNGVIGGIGLGLGYISPVSTLIKWFPDRPGMATGMAIMGFGGGAMIASPLSQFFLDRYQSATSTGVIPTFLIMGLIYFVFMMFGTFAVRIPYDGWRPAGWNPDKAKKSKLISDKNVVVENAVRTPQFYFLFIVLMLNVTAGIGVLGVAKDMITEMFSEEVVGKDMAVTATQAAGFVGLLSVFNMLGRFFWASLSDKIGRKTTYAVYFTLGVILYATVPSLGASANIALFVLAFLIIMSMYGGGFSTIPAYIKDLFGTINVGAIHGRVLLAWSAAAILGPVLVNYIRDYQIKHGVPKSQAYSVTMYVMAVLLVVGSIANLLIKPVNKKYHYD